MGRRGVLEVMLGSTCGGGIESSPYCNELCTLTAPFVPPHLF